MAKKIVLTKVSFMEPVEIPTIGVLGSISLGQGELVAQVADDPEGRCVLVTSRDERYKDRRVRVPYENIKAFHETVEEVPSAPTEVVKAQVKK